MLRAMISHYYQELFILYLDTTALVMLFFTSKQPEQKIITWCPIFHFTLELLVWFFFCFSKTTDICGFFIYFFFTFTVAVELLFCIIILRPGNEDRPWYVSEIFESHFMLLC